MGKLIIDGTVLALNSGAAEDMRRVLWLIGLELGLVAPGRLLRVGIHLPILQA